MSGGAHPDPALMRRAIEAAREGMLRGDGGPFGALIADREGNVLAVAHNTVLRGDATAHAEVNAIREACARRGSPFLDGTVIYSTTEPCPMCFAAIHWARIAATWWGTRIGDVARLGFRELVIDNETMKRLGGSPVEIHAGLLRDECLALLADWRRLPQRRTY